MPVASKPDHEVYGAGQPLMYLHGGFNPIEMFGKNLPALAERHRVGISTGLATLAAPFLLVRRMRLVEGWRDQARRASFVGVAVAVALVAYGALQNTGLQGRAQRVAAVLVPLGIVALALRVRRLAGTEAGTTAWAADSRPARS